MNNYEKLLDIAEKENISVYENYDFSNTRIDGLYCDGSIALSKDLETEAEKKCVMQEELGHHYTSHGNIIDHHDVSNRKQEHRARVWAYRNAIGLPDIISAYKHGCRNRFEIAEHLNLTESFLLGAIEDYKAQYGLCTRVDNYVVYFEPLGVLELNI